MDSLTLLVSVIETALLNDDPATSLSPLDALYALQDRAEAAEAKAAQHWIEASVAPRNQTGLAYYLTRHGKGRIVRATFVATKSVIYDGDDYDFGNYDEADGEYYLPAGWYERVENGDYDYYPIDGAVKYFMPLPAPPVDGA